MVELIAAAVVLVGALFLFFGSTFSSYGVSALGIVVGGSAGYLAGPAIAGSLAVSVTVASAGGALLGAGLGVVLSYFLLSMAVAALGFVLGSYLGWTVVAGLVLENGSFLLEILVALAVGLVAGVVGKVFTKSMMVVLTAFVGAALASMSVTAQNLVDSANAVHPEPLLFDVTAPLFVGLFIVGVAMQFGLLRLGYVTKLLTVIPGIRPLKNRGA